MDGIQAYASKKTPVAANPAMPANDDTSAAGVFASLLDVVGARFKGDATLGAEAKLARGDDAANQRAAEARDAREAAKARDEKNNERAAKPKDTKSRDDKRDDNVNENKASVKDDAGKSERADAAQTAPKQTAAPVVDVAALEVPLITIETIAPVLVAQQAATTTDTALTQQAAAQIATEVTVAAPVVGEVVEAVAAAANTTQKIATLEAPAAVQKAGETNLPGFKQVVAETTAAVQTVTAPTTEKTTVATADTGVAKTKENAQAEIVTQRSAAAQQQSQDLSQKVGSDTKAQVHVTVTNHAGPQATLATSIYDIYSGYNNTQSSSTNAPAEVSNALTASPKAAAEAAQAQVAPVPVALQSQPQAPQPGASPSAMRADIAAAPTLASGNAGFTSHGESNFGGPGTNTNSQTNAATASTATTATERPLATPQQIIDQIKVNITRAAKAGLDKVTIQLKPVELGRVDVQLEMSEDHKVRVTVTADNKDTLALLQNDSRTLERALNDAGLRTDSNNLHFNLRSESDAQTAGDGKNGGKNQSGSDAGAADDADDIAMTYDYGAAANARGGVDTFA
jgi:flagellar hook-length control protein FliK